MLFARHPIKILISVLLITMLCLIPTNSARAQLGGAVIRDTEIENTLKLWIDPLLKAANMAPGSVNVILIQNNELNAFVAGGANIFIYTGLIEKTENPGELIGVMAHELGHISGGHLIATHAALERASYESIIGVVVGAAAAIATGNGGAAAAISQGASSMAARRFLAHSRIHESSADQAALTFMDKADIDPSGLASFLEKLESEELLPASQQSEYMRTHPISRNRVDALETRMTQSPYNGAGFSPNMTEQHKRMKAKLTGFINPGNVAWKYDDRDTSIAADYARAIAAYRLNKPEEALRRIDGLLSREPDNPYFMELKGQVLVDFGHVKEALPLYQKAVEILPNAGLIRIALAHAIMESGGNDEKTLKNAIGNLERALKDEPRSGYVHRLLATAYGKLGQEDIAKVHLAEEALLQRRYDYARQLASDALKTLPENSRERLKAQDIISYLENIKDK